jgi:cytochrome c-type biogenesis protein CcmE
MISKKRIVVVGLVFAIGIGYLIVSAVRETGVYYIEVSELVHGRTESSGEGLRIQGSVVDGSTVWDPSGPQLSFVMADSAASVAVIYDGFRPDTYREGEEVIVEGRYDREAGAIQATKLMTTCPSKYVESGEDEDHE